MWVFEGVWVICAKPPFLLDLDVPIKMFAKNLAGKHWEGLCSSCMAKYTLVYACTNKCFRCTKCVGHDRVCKHVIRCSKTLVPRFPIPEAL